MPYRVQLVDGQTWRPAMEIKPKSGSWGRARNSGRGGQCTIQANDPDHFEGTQRTPVWPFQQWIVVDWAPPGSVDWKILYAGVITEAAYDWATKVLALTHSDIWVFWDRRFVLADRTNDLASSKVTWSNISPQTMAVRAVKAGVNAQGSPLRYAMPVVFPAETIGALDRVIYGYSLETVRDILDDVMESENGPDIDFRPRWSTEGTLEWVMEFNANKSVVFDYNLDADQTPVTGMTYQLSGTGLANKVYGLGEGTEKKMLVRQSSGDLSPYPALEADESFKEVKKLTQLQDRTTGARKALDGAIRQVSLKVRDDGPPRVTDLRLGATIRWKADKDSWLLSGWSQGWELIEYSGPMTSGDVSLDFQEMEGRSGG